MKVEDYSFGRIVIRGRVYTNDVIIYPERVEAPWRRERGHEVSLDDIGDILAQAAQHVIIGTGFSGRMRVPETVLSALREYGAEVVIARTREAVRIYNDEADGPLAVAALHLTC